MGKNRIKQAEVRNVMRSEIQFAEYNPRFITEDAYKGLKANLKKRGLMGGIVWNETTGNLVSGHQRVTAMDEVNKYDPENPETDYELRVEVVQLTDTEEKEQNMFMNNPKVQGEFDNNLVREMFLADSSINFKNVGFDDLDMQMMGIDLISNEDIGLDASGNYDDGDIDALVMAQVEERQREVAERQRQAEQAKEEGETKKDWSMDNFKDDEDAREVDQHTRSMEENRNLKRSENFYEADTDEQIARHNEIRKIKERINNKASDDNDGGMFSYLVVKFEAPAQRAHFLEMLGYDDITLNQVDGLELQRRIEEGE